MISILVAASIVGIIFVVVVILEVFICPYITANK